MRILSPLHNTRPAYRAAPRPITATFLSLLFLTPLASAQIEQSLIPAPAAQAPAYRLWPSNTPKDCPFPPSKDLSAIAFTGKHAEYTGADTWYPSWASDGNMYSPWTDGNVNGLGCSSGGKDAATGHAKIVGDDPLKLQVLDQAIFKSAPTPYEGRYPCGSLVYNGVWYYGTYCLHPSGSVNHTDGVTYNWPWLGPFVGFRYSTDFGKTWTQTPCTPAKPLFGESALKGEPVKIGSPHFVDFGKNMQHSPDAKAYLVAHGASDSANRRFAYNSWITGDEIYLTRVIPSIQNINDLDKYEFFAGHDNNKQPLWTSDFSKIKPIAAWKDNMGCVTITYNAPLKKYLMCVTDGTNTCGYFNTYILESDRITGPFNLVQYMHHFGEQAYFVNIPSKFISPDGRTLWLCYAANFAPNWNNMAIKPNPRGSRYAMCLQQLKLLSPTDAAQSGPLNSPDDIATQATLTVSSTHLDYSPEGAIDGIVGGFPKDISQEWTSRAESTTAMLRLSWDSDQTIDRIWLFDRPNPLDQITAGMLIFSDGSTIPTKALPDDATRGLQVTFPPKKVKWIIFAVTDVKPNSPNIGLSEIAVFRAKP